MQEKVLNYLKSHFQGIATAVLVLIAIFIGYVWGMNGFIGDINDGDIAIVEVAASGTVPVATTTKITKSPVYKVVVKKKTTNTVATVTASTTAPQSMDYMRFFYGAGTVESAPSAPVQQNND